jgi:hydroxyacylglutathione hydrolase
MDIYRLPAFRDNYIFLLHDRQLQIAAVVDPGDGVPVLNCLRELGATLAAIFNTHHHSDHVGGNQLLLEHFPEVVVYGGSQDRDRIPGQQVFLEEGDGVSLGERSGQVLFVPGHTRAHIAYYFPPPQGEIWANYSVVIPCLQGAVVAFSKVPPARWLTL